MRQFLSLAALLLSLCTGCRTANVRVIDAATGAPAAGVNVRPRYRSLIMGHPVTRLGPGRCTDAEGRATLRTHWEQEFHSFYVDGTKAQRRPNPDGETLLLIHPE